jgi:ribonuclease-3
MDPNVARSAGAAFAAPGAFKTKTFLIPRFCCFTLRHREQDYHCASLFDILESSYLKDSMQKDLLPLSTIESRLKMEFLNADLLLLAFVHRSYWNENQESVKEHNERLEFLGDSVLGLIVAEYLYTHLPLVPEGGLSDLRARLVDAPACMSYVHKLEIEEFILLGKGEKTNVGKGRESILADLFEALMGAIYLDGGYARAKSFFLETFKIEIEQMLQEPSKNWKAELQDYAQKKTGEPPQYEVLEESGPAHQKQFKIGVYIVKKLVGTGVGGSKKEAQTDAARNALEKMESDEAD